MSRQVIQLRENVRLTWDDVLEDEERMYAGPWTDVVTMGREKRLA